MQGTVLYLPQAKEVSAESAAWASEFADKQDASNAADFEDIWKHYGEVQEISHRVF